jgi:hypothetical protein
MDGPTRHLKIVDSKKFPQTLKREAHEKGEELQERVAQKPSTKFTLRLKHGLGISLIDATPQEVVYVSFGDINVEYCYSEAYGASYASFCVHQFQVTTRRPSYASEAVTFTRECIDALCCRWTTCSIPRLCRWWCSRTPTPLRSCA